MKTERLILRRWYECKPHVSFANDKRGRREKKRTDATRIKQQKEAVEEDESRFADLVDGLYDTSGSSGPNGPELP